jgi:hypothetical protein
MRGEHLPALALTVAALALAVAGLVWLLERGGSWPLLVTAAATVCLFSGARLKHRHERRR